MSKLIPAAERIIRARALIQQARDLPIPTENGRNNFSYIAQVKSLLQQARDLIKFIRLTPSATPEIKEEVNKIYQEADQADREILHG
jgi:Flp pilus assembly protein TadD